MDDSRKTQSQLLSEALSNFDTSVEFDPQRLIEYQSQPAHSHPDAPIYPSLPVSSQVLWALLLLVHLWVLWKKK
jgi:hypothetical protein